MNRRKRLLFGLMVAAVTLLTWVPLCLAVEMTITGKVSADLKIQAQDGTVYLIEEDDMGETVIVYDGRIVMVTGDVTTDGNQKVITVTNFKVVKN